jgi:hypothetical protein
MAARWRGYYTQPPGVLWPDETVAQAATCAAGARLAHQLRFCEAEAGNAADAAQQAEERIGQRAARREKALVHNEASAAKSLELEASARAARARMLERRQAVTASMAPEEVQAIDAARDAEIEHALVVARGEQARRARQLQAGWDRGLDRNRPGLGF